MSIYQVRIRLDETFSGLSTSEFSRFAALVKQAIHTEFAECDQVDIEPFQEDSEPMVEVLTDDLRDGDVPDEDGVWSDDPSDTFEIDDILTEFYNDRQEDWRDSA